MTLCTKNILNPPDSDCITITSERIWDQESESSVRHTNTPCFGLDSITPLYLSQKAKEKDESPYTRNFSSPKLKYVKLDLNKIPTYQWKKRKNISAAPDKLYNLSHKKTTANNSPISPCISLKKERASTSRTYSSCKVDRPCKICFGEVLETGNETGRSNEELRMSTTEPCFQVRSIIQRSRKMDQCDGGCLYSQIQDSVYYLSNIRNTHSGLKVLGRPLKKERGKYRPASMINMTISNKEPFTKKSSKSADAYLRHLRVSKEAGSKCSATRMDHYPHSRCSDTRLLEAVSKYNEPQWEGLIDRQLVKGVFGGFGKVSQLVYKPQH